MIIWTIGAGNKCIAQIQVNKYILKINSAQGLSHNVVNDVKQDDEGFIWVATQDGLNRYDGYLFKVFRFDPEDSTSISDNYIKSIYYDHKKSLWISTRYGLNLYNPADDNFHRFRFGTGDELDITKITGSRNGGLWICNYLGGVYYFNTSENTFRQIIPNEQSQEPAMTVVEDNQGFLWVGTGGQGAHVYSLNYLNAVPDIVLNERLKKLNLKFVEAIFNDNAGNIWIGSRNGLVLYQRRSDEFFQFHKTMDPLSLGGNIILDITQDYRGNLLIGTQEGGLSILTGNQLKESKPQAFRFQKILQGNEDYNLSYRSVQSVFEDRDRNIWLGTYGNGLNLIPFQQPKFSLIMHNTDKPNTLNLGKVWGICEDTDGNLWIGTDGMGINKIDLDNGKVSHFLSGSQNGSLSDDAILCALCDTRGRLWFGTYAGGLNLLKKGSNSFLHVNLDPENGTGQITKDIRCIFEDKNGIIWIGTNGNGLRKLNPDDFTVEPIIPKSAEYSAFDIRAITQDDTGMIWLGTYGGGLFSYDPVTKTSNQFSYDRFRQGSLKCNIIYSLLFDAKRNCLWIGGSQNGGLNRMDIKSHSFTVYDDKIGLGNNNIHAIEKDEKGRIWVSTNTGVSLFIPEEKKFFNYNKLDGVQTKEFSDGSVFKSKKRKYIFFGGSGGLNYFDPDNIGISDAKTHILITELNILTEPDMKQFDRMKNVLKRTDLLYPDNVILRHTQNIFTIGFSGIYYSNPEKILYQYKLEGEDQNWINLGNLQYVTFRNLKPGDYKFIVRASNEDGIWSDDSDSLEITIQPPFWRTWWAYLFYLLVTCAIILWIYFYNLKEAKIRHNLILEKRMRSQEHELHEEKLIFFTNISHEIRTPLMLLINPLEDLITKESKNTTLGRTFNSMYRSANSLLQLINMLLEFRKMEKGKLRLNAGKRNIVEQVKENCLAFKGLTEKKKIQLDFISEEEEINIWFDREKLEMILNNLLSNAVKNTASNKNITVSVRTLKESDPEFPEGRLIIEVKDEGNGIPADQLNRIFDGFYQVRGSGESGGTGIGLTLTKKLVEMHKGTIRVESEINHGTLFTISMPMGESHLSEEEKIFNPASSVSSDIFLQDSDSDSPGKTLDKISSLSKGKKRILIIEDNGEIRTYFFELLNDYFIIDFADNGLAGLEKAREIQPELVISDIMMPGIDGIELCRTLKSDVATSHIPVLLITANVSHHIHINSLEVGADAYITKPFKPDLLISRIYNLLKSSENLREYYINKFHNGFIPEDSSLSRDEEFLISVNRIILQNIDNSDFSISQLHEELCMSRTVFYNKIKSLTNCSPIDLIRQIRMRKAAELLLTRKYKVFEVMYQVGFNDEKHFRHLFKNQYGVTATEYQNTRNK